AGPTAASSHGPRRRPRCERGGCWRCLRAGSRSSRRHGCSAPGLGSSYFGHFSADPLNWGAGAADGRPGSSEPRWAASAASAAPHPADVGLVADPTHPASVAPFGLKLVENGILPGHPKAAVLAHVSEGVATNGGCPAVVALADGNNGDALRD